MAEMKLVDAPFPLFGVVRRFGRKDADALSEKPFTPWAVNMRPQDPFTERYRGGSRPGLAPYVGDAQPEWPTGALADETGALITTEAGDEIHVPVGGAEALYADLADAMRAYGYGSIPDDITATVGTAPTNVSIGCTYRDRLILASDNIVYMSRLGDWTDWDYGGDVEDAGRAFLLQLSEAGEFGDTVSAMIPHRDAAMLLATTNELWVVEGDPCDQGSLKCVSRDVGIVGATAWTKVGDAIVFLAKDGLWKVGFNGSGLEPLSGDKLPDELSDIDASQYGVMLGYRHSENGVYVFVEGDHYHWFFDLTFKGFWPFELRSIVVEAAFVADGELVIKDDSGQFWTFDGEDDDGLAIQSHVLLGPVRAASGVEYSLLSAIHGAVETEPNGSVTWRIITADTAELACERAKDAVDTYRDGDTVTSMEYVVASGTWTDGRSRMSYPRNRGMWHVIWLESESVWACENVVAEMYPVGRWR